MVSVGIKMAGLCGYKDGLVSVGTKMAGQTSSCQEGSLAMWTENGSCCVGGSARVVFPRLSALFSCCSPIGFADFCEIILLIVMIALKDTVRDFSNLLRHELSPTRILKWPGRITCNTSRVCHVRHVVCGQTARYSLVHSSSSSSSSAFPSYISGFYHLW